jgi:hypothetical protein
MFKVRQGLNDEKGEISLYEFISIFTISIFFSFIFAFFIYPSVSYILIGIGIDGLCFLLKYLLLYNTFDFTMHMQDKDPDNTNNLKGRKVELMQGKDNNKDAKNLTLNELLKATRVQQDSLKTLMQDKYSNDEERNRVFEEIFIQAQVIEDNIKTFKQNMEFKIQKNEDIIKKLPPTEI